MAVINENFLKLPSNYLFPEINRRVSDFRAENPGAEVISLGLGDVTRPLTPAIVEAMQKAVRGMSRQETFFGYGPPQGYDFLANTILENEYLNRGIKFSRDEIFISDGAKCDVTNIQEIFGQNNIVAVTDPYFPLYVDSNVMAGRTGLVNKNGQYEKMVYLPCSVENSFVPELPQSKVDLIYLCFPNNPTGIVLAKSELKRWIDFAKKNKAIILFDAAYEAYIREPDIPHSIYEIDGAKEVAIEIRSFSKTAGFTGLRCGYTIIPKQLVAFKTTGEKIEVNPIWYRRQTTKFNGASYITQVGAAAVYTEEGKKQSREIIDRYMENAYHIRKHLTKLGYSVYGGSNAPYLWMKTPDGKSSWEYFDFLLNRANLVCTPGAGFGSQGEGYVRLSTFTSPTDVNEAMKRFAKL